MHFQLYYYLNAVSFVARFFVVYLLLKGIVGAKFFLITLRVRTSNNARQNKSYCHCLYYAANNLIVVVDCLAFCLLTTMLLLCLVAV